MIPSRSVSISPIALVTYTVIQIDLYTTVSWHGRPTLDVAVFGRFQQPGGTIVYLSMRLPLIPVSALLGRGFVSHSYYEIRVLSNFRINRSLLERWHIVYIDFAFGVPN
jgi:hypothetical protein